MKCRPARAQWRQPRNGNFGLSVESQAGPRLYMVRRGLFVRAAQKKWARSPFSLLASWFVHRRTHETSANREPSMLWRPQTVLFDAECPGRNCRVRQFAVC
jgi:hypothetical protein